MIEFKYNFGDDNIMKHERCIDALAILEMGEIHHLMIELCNFINCIFEHDQVSSSDDEINKRHQMAILEMGELHHLMIISISDLKLQF